MLKIYIGTILLVIALIVCSLGPINPAYRVIDSQWIDHESTLVEADVQTIFNAIQQKDFATFDNYLPGEILSGGDGGAYLSRHQEILNDLASDSIEIEQIQLASPPDFYQSRSYDWAVLPTEAVLNYSDSKVAQHGFLLGVRLTNEPSWKYVDFTLNWQDARLYVEQLYPDIPKSVFLPRCAAEYHQPAL